MVLKVEGIKKTEFVVMEQIQMTTIVEKGKLDFFHTETFLPRWSRIRPVIIPKVNQAHKTKAFNLNTNLPKAHHKFGRGKFDRKHKLKQPSDVKKLRLFIVSYICIIVEK